MTLDNHPPSVDESWERTCQLLGWDRAAVESTILSLRETPILANLSLVVEAASERQPRRDGPFQVRSVAVLYVSLAATARTVCVTYAPRFAVGAEGPEFSTLLEGFAEAMASGAAARELGAAKLPEEMRPPILRIAAETVRARRQPPRRNPEGES